MIKQGKKEARSKGQRLSDTTEINRGYKKSEIKQD